MFAQHRSKWLALAVAPLASLTGCHAKPDHIVTFRSPDSPVYYTVETYYGHGAVSNDYTRVYAHFSHSGKTAKIDVLDGEYLQNSTVAWTSPTDVDICVPGGITDTFRNQVTLITGDDPSSSYTIYNHFKEHC